MLRDADECRGEATGGVRALLAALKASVVGWAYDWLGTEATILNSMAIVFCAFRFGYCLDRSSEPMDQLGYVFVGKDYDRPHQHDTEGKS